MSPPITSCKQHDAGSVIADQRMHCNGKVVAIPYEVFNEWGFKVFGGVTTVCEGHKPLWNGRALELHGYRLGKPEKIGAIGENPESSSVDLEHEH